MNFVRIVRRCMPEFNMDMDKGSWIGIAGIVIGALIAFWQWHGAKKQGSNLVAFLHGLKASNLPTRAIEQINDQLARLDPPKK